MLSSELDFGKLLRTLDVYNELPASEARQFVNTVKEMSELLADNWVTDSESPSESKLTKRILEDIEQCTAISPDNSEYIIDVVENMMWDMDIGDMDDAFGTEGWRHRLGWI